MSIRSSKRPAQIVAVSLNVLCPYCGEPQPNPVNGAEIWLPEEVQAAQGDKHSCVSCDCTFPIHAESKVQVLP